MFRLVSIALALALSSGPVSADDDVAGKKLMLAAAVVLSDLSNHLGVLDVDSPNKAFFRDGSAFFRKLADCRYSQFSPASGQPDWFEIVDFGALDGNYRLSATFGVQHIIVEGRSPKTRCFLFSGESGCTNDIRIVASPAERDRIITNLQYILQSCQGTSPDPY